MLENQMEEDPLIPHLFRTEYRKLCAVLYHSFGVDYMEIVEDLVSDTFLHASELWAVKGIPENPVAWLYTVAKNKTRDYFRRNNLFANTISGELRKSSNNSEEFEMDLSMKNINDSQLAMIFVACHPCNNTETQIALALNLLCGFNAVEIGNAFLTNREVIYKRLQRGKSNLKIKKIKIEQPTLFEINERLPAVLMTLYLLFNEGYYSASQDTTLRKDLCVEAMRLCFLLSENEITNTTEVNALMSLMCFQSSRFDARTDEKGEIILYNDQDERLWDKELIGRGVYYLREAGNNAKYSKFYLEAAIACWHTMKQDSETKWQNVLDLYNELLIVEYSPIAALNRTYALAKVKGKKTAIIEAEKLPLKENHLYHMLLGKLYEDLDIQKALNHYQFALSLAVSEVDKHLIRKNLNRLID